MRWKRAEKEAPKTDNEVQQDEFRAHYNRLYDKANETLSLLRSMSYEEDHLVLHEERDVLIDKAFSLIGSLSSNVLYQVILNSDVSQLVDKHAPIDAIPTPATTSTQFTQGEIESDGSSVWWGSCDSATASIELAEQSGGEWEIWHCWSFHQNASARTYSIRRTKLGEERYIEDTEPRKAYEAQVAEVRSTFETKLRFQQKHFLEDHDGAYHVSLLLGKMLEENGSEITVFAEQVEEFVADNRRAREARDERITLGQLDAKRDSIREIEEFLA